MKLSRAEWRGRVGRAAAVRPEEPEHREEQHGDHRGERERPPRRGGDRPVPLRLEPRGGGRELVRAVGDEPDAEQHEGAAEGQGQQRAAGGRRHQSGDGDAARGHGQARAEPGGVGALVGEVGAVVREVVGRTVPRGDAGFGGAEGHGRREARRVTISGRSDATESDHERES